MSHTALSATPRSPWTIHLTAACHLYNGLHPIVKCHSWPKHEAINIFSFSYSQFTRRWNTCVCTNLGISYMATVNSLTWICKSKPQRHNWHKWEWSRVRHIDKQNSKEDTRNVNGHRQRFRHFRTKRHLYFEMPFLWKQIRESMYL